MHPSLILPHGSIPSNLSPCTCLSYFHSRSAINFFFLFLSPQSVKETINTKYSLKRLTAPAFLPPCRENRGRQLSGQSFQGPSHQPRWCLCPEPRKSAANSSPPFDRGAGFHLWHPGTLAVAHTSLLAEKWNKEVKSWQGIPLLS